MIDVEVALAPVSPDQPSGANLEYDPSFTGLLQLARGKPEQRMGDSILPAEEPNWRDVGKRAADLLKQSKDLRVVNLLAKAQLRTDGVAGFASSLSFLRGLVDRYWETLHPQLDPDDGNDPTQRISLLTELASPDATLNALRGAPLASARGVGQVTLRDVEAAQAPKPATDGEAGKNPGPPIDAVFTACNLEDLKAVAQHTQAALADVKGIEELVGQKAGGRRPDLAKLKDVLNKTAKLLADNLAKRGAASQPANGEAAAPGGANAMTSMPVNAVALGPIGSREDVLRALDAICEYYERCEPASPVPLLMRRSKRLVSANFLDIIRDLAPNGVEQVETLRGKVD